MKKLFHTPAHPYTRGLLESIPRLDTPHKTHLKVIEGMVPSLRDIPAGCRFSTRCDYVMDRCRQIDPPVETVGDDPEHRVACIRHNEIAA